jgi:hypothetical protein
LQTPACNQAKDKTEQILRELEPVIGQMLLDAPDYGLCEIALRFHGDRLQFFTTRVEKSIKVEQD